MALFEIDDFNEARLLYMLLMSHKYAPNPSRPELFAHPLIAQMTERLAETLLVSQTLLPDSTIWRRLVKNTVELHGAKWDLQSIDTKRQVAKYVLIPFNHDDDLIEQFVRAIDGKLTIHPD